MPLPRPLSGTCRLRLAHAVAVGRVFEVARLRRYIRTYVYVCTYMHTYTHTTHTHTHHTYLRLDDTGSVASRLLLFHRRCPSLTVGEETLGSLTVVARHAGVAVIRGAIGLVHAGRVPSIRGVRVQRVQQSRQRR
jgi:hypothetical protein